MLDSRVFIFSALFLGIVVAGTASLFLDDLGDAGTVIEIFVGWVTFAVLFLCYHFLYRRPFLERELDEKMKKKGYKKTPDGMFYIRG